MDCTVHGIQVRILKWVAFPSPGDFPNPGIEPRSLALQVDSLPAEPQRKVKNTGVGSLSFIQWIFLTQESNQGLLHCRWILYELSSQGSPVKVKSLSHAWLFVTPWTAACPTPLAMGFSRQECWSFHILLLWMWELDHKEGWAPKNWCFWTMVLGKTLDSPLDC